MLKPFPWRALALAVWSLLLVLWFNTDFGVYTQISQQLEMNDVAGIVAGFRATPDVWVDGLKWWHGPWIQSGIEVLRPVSSFMLWWECYFGLRDDFTGVAWWGVALFSVACWLTVALAWRATRSWWCAAIAATLMPLLRFWNMGGSQPQFWLA